MKPAKIAVICIAAVSAIGLALVVRAMGSSGEPVSRAAADAPAAEILPTINVLVAARDLEPGVRLAEADLTWKAWPEGEVNPLFITDGAPAAVVEAQPEGAVARVSRAAAAATSGPGLKSDYIGSVVREPILAGEPLNPRKIVRAGDSGYLAAYLEPGMRAMAVRVTVETAAGGFILPGDRVDVLLTRESRLSDVAGDESGRSRFSSSTVMQNVKVLAIDQATRAADDAHAVVGATATLEVGARDAENLALAKSEGELSLVLRSYADAAGPSGTVSAPQTQSAAVRIYRGGPAEVVVVQ